MEKFLAPLDQVFHALADPTRRAVVQRLGRGPASVSELAQPFGMGLPAFLKHLGVLEASGLVATAKRGRIRTCRLNTEQLDAAEAWFQEQRALWQDRYDQLDTLIDSLKGDTDAH